MREVPKVPVALWTMSPSLSAVTASMVNSDMTVVGYVRYMLKISRRASHTFKVTVMDLNTMASRGNDTIFSLHSSK